MATLTRIYRITIGESDRLVRAAHPAGALMHVARDIARVSVASQDDLVECIADGIKVETAGEDTPAPAKAPNPTPAPVDGGAPLFEGLDDDLDEISDAEGLDMHGGADDADDEPRLSSTTAPAVAVRGKPGAAYRNAETGESWSGRGLKPRWLVAQLSAGRQLAEQLRTAQREAEAIATQRIVRRGEAAEPVLAALSTQMIAAAETDRSAFNNLLAAWNERELLKLTAREAGPWNDAWATGAEPVAIEQGERHA